MRLAWEPDLHPCFISWSSRKLLARPAIPITAIARRRPDCLREAARHCARQVQASSSSRVSEGLSGSSPMPRTRWRRPAGEGRRETGDDLRRALHSDCVETLEEVGIRPQGNLPCKRRREILASFPVSMTVRSSIGGHDHRDYPAGIARAGWISSIFAYRLIPIVPTVMGPINRALAIRLFGLKW